MKERLRASDGGRPSLLGEKLGRLEIEIEVSERMQLTGTRAVVRRCRGHAHRMVKESVDEEFLSAVGTWVGARF